MLHPALSCVALADLCCDCVYAGRNRYTQKAHVRLWASQSWKEHEVYERKRKYELEENKCCDCGLDDVKSIFCRGYRCYAAEIGCCNDRAEPGTGYCGFMVGAFGTAGIRQDRKPPPTHIANPYNKLAHLGPVWDDIEFKAAAG